MKKMLIALLALSISAFSLSDSFIRVINHTDEPLQAIWQAGGCAEVTEDWTGDTQLTVCQRSHISPGKEHRYDFNLWQSDRSVKVFAKGRTERIGYCSSMGYSSLTFTKASDGDFLVDVHCPNG